MPFFCRAGGGARRGTLPACISSQVLLAVLIAITCSVVHITSPCDDNRWCARERACNTIYMFRGAVEVILQSSCHATWTQSHARRHQRKKKYINKSCIFRYIREHIKGKGGARIYDAKAETRQEGSCSSRDGAHQGYSQASPLPFPLHRLSPTRSSHYFDKNPTLPVTASNHPYRGTHSRGHKKKKGKQRAPPFIIHPIFYLNPPAVGKTSPPPSPVSPHAPTLGSPTRICANWPDNVAACHGARAPTPGPADAALAGPPVLSAAVGLLFGPYGFGSELWRWRPCVTTCGDAELARDAVADAAWCCCCCCCCCCPSAGCCCAAAVGERALVMPGTEMKYTEPVGSVPPCA